MQETRVTLRGTREVLEQGCLWASAVGDHAQLATLEHLLTALAQLDVRWAQLVECRAEFAQQQAEFVARCAWFAEQLRGAEELSIVAGTAG